MEKLDLALNYDHLREASSIWLRRASVFLGIGANVAQMEHRVSHVLDDRVQFQFVTTTPSDEEKAAFISEFDTWIIACALRELIEGHSSFLQQAYFASEIIASGGIQRVELAKRAKAFELQNVTEQRKKLSKLLGIQDHFEPMFDSLVIARNCLAHRNGIVGLKDCNETNSLKLEWRFHGLLVPDENGNYRHLDLNSNEHYVTTKDEVLKFGPVEKSKVFLLGEHMRLSRHDLAEIVFGIFIAAETIIEAMMKILPPQANDVTVPT